MFLRTLAEYPLGGSITGHDCPEEKEQEFALSYSWAKELCRRLKNGDNGEALETHDSAEVRPKAGDLAKALRVRPSTKFSTSTVKRRLGVENLPKQINHL